MAEPVAREPLNVLIVLADSTRQDHMHFAHYERSTTPHLDEFARNSAVSQAHFSSSSLTGPAVASVFTGLTPSDHGVVNSPDDPEAAATLADSHVTLAERFREAGYNTYGVVTNADVDRQLGFAQGFDVYDFFPSEDHGRRVNQRAAELLDGRGGTDAPFFMYLHYMNPHSPYEPDPEFRGLFSSPGYEGPIDGSVEQLNAIVGGEFVPESADVEQLKALYDEEIRSFDERFGELLDELGRRDLRRRTIIVFLSDHGEELLDHESALHGYTLYNEQIFVPFIIHDPLQRTRGWVPGSSRHTDLLPTLLELTDLTPELGTTGVDLFSAPESERYGNVDSIADSVRTTVSEVQLQGVRAVRSRSIVNGRWKLIVNDLPAESVQLFDLSSDFAERNNVAEEHPDVVVELEAKLRSATRSHAVTAAPDSVTLSAGELEALRALGLEPGDDEASAEPTE